MTTAPPTTVVCPTCKAPWDGDAVCAACGQVLAAPRVVTLETVEFVVLGDPIPQGSMRHIGRGRMVSDNPKLKGWRQRVTASAQAALGPGWTPWDGPVAMDLVITLPRPKSAPKTKVTFPATKPDLDKLMRAIGDSLCPKTGFKTLQEDSRIVEVGQLVKTFPAPMHTHPGALPEPGIRVRLRRLSVAPGSVQTR